MHVVVSPWYASFVKHSLHVLRKSVDSHVLLGETNAVTFVGKGSSVETSLCWNGCQVFFHYSNKAAGIGGVGMVAETFGPCFTVCISRHCLGQTALKLQEFAVIFISSYSELICPQADMFVIARNPNTLLL